MPRLNPDIMGNDWKVEAGEVQVLPTQGGGSPHSPPSPACLLAAIPVEPPPAPRSGAAVGARATGRAGGPRRLSVPLR